MKYIVMTFPRALYWQPDAPYHGNINKFIIGGVSPKTVTGEVRVTMTTYEALEEFIAAEQETGNINHPGFVDFMKQLVNDGVLLLPDYPFRRGKGYFKLDFVVRVTNTAFASGKVPSGGLQSLGTGEEGDAPEGQLRTWQQWVNMTRIGQINHENETHKFFTYHTFGNSTPTHAEFVAILNHTASGFKLLSMNEYNAQLATDLL